MLLNKAGRVRPAHGLMMRRYVARLLVCCLIVSSFGFFTLAAVAQDASAEIKSMLERQVTDWNRGDVDAFATGYKNSPDILFIGAHVSRGYAAMLAGYKARYPTREAMGTLSFKGLEVQALDERFATATGKFRLQRSAKVGGEAQGHFLLVLEKTPSGWKIVRDDTTAESSQTK